MTDLTRPIIGIENRTAQEVFDIMCARFRTLSAITPAEVGELVGRLRRKPNASWSELLDEAATALEDQVARAERVDAALAEARKALEPFAAFAEEMDTAPNGYPWKDADHIMKGISAGNFRAARRALTGGQEDG